MVFSSVTFLFAFLPIVLTIYLMTPRKARNALLLGASLLFYAWGETWFVLVMLASIILDYFCGLAIAGVHPFRGIDNISVLDPQEPRRATQKVALAASISGNLAILAFFKYFNFGVENFNEACNLFGLSGLTWGSPPEIILPIGISFFTFQSMSYTIDIYRGNTAATRDFVRFATFVSMFPQLVAGPIVRYTEIARELVQRSLTLPQISLGIRRFCIGLAKKVIIANTVAVPADYIFALPSADLTAPLAWLAVVSYTLQIYFDFSGYSDMAIGLGHILGFSFPENFLYPYSAQSIQEFWRRWHISLSSWFRDYLYIPLGGNRHGECRTLANLVTVFFLCGLWHGASWTFIVWGLYHGSVLVLERTKFGALIHRAPRFARHAYTLIVVLVGWVLFRSDSFGHAIAILRAMIGLGSGSGEREYLALYLTNDVLAAILLGSFFAFPVVPFIVRSFREWYDGHTGSRVEVLRTIDLTVSAITIFALFLCAVIMLAAQTHNPFIYFRF